MILSLIQRGDIKGGIKYIPAFGTVSVFVYYILARLFSGLVRTVLA
jgi:hypothetical protein